MYGCKQGCSVCKNTVVICFIGVISSSLWFLSLLLHGGLSDCVLLPHVIQHHSKHTLCSDSLMENESFSRGDRECCACCCTTFMSRNEKCCIPQSVSLLLRQMGINMFEVNVLGYLWSQWAINVFAGFPFSKSFLQPQGLGASKSADWHFGWNWMAAKKYEVWLALFLVCLAEELLRKEQAVMSKADSVLKADKCLSALELDGSVLWKFKVNFI